MGLGPEEARRTIRVSAGWETACEDWDALAEVIIGLAGGEW
jgi:cysteine sulfinate desulfinase/cysteine desulfurase-like protein